MIFIGLYNLFPYTSFKINPFLSLLLLFLAVFFLSLSCIVIIYIPVIIHLYHVCPMKQRVTTERQSTWHFGKLSAALARVWKLWSVNRQTHTFESDKWRLAEVGLLLKGCDAPTAPVSTPNPLVLLPDLGPSLPQMISLNVCWAKEVPGDVAVPLWHGMPLLLLFRLYFCI